MNTKKILMLLVSLVAVFGLLALSQMIFANSAYGTTIIKKQDWQPDRNPREAVELFYEWYMDYSGHPLVDGAYRANEYLTGDFIQGVDEFLTTPDSSDYDPFLCAQDKPDRFNVEDGDTSADQNSAVVIVQEVWNFGTKHEITQDLKVRLQCVNGKWKIANIDCLGSDTIKISIAAHKDKVNDGSISPQLEGPIIDTPDGSVNAFYCWYLWYAKEIGNPLIEKAYHGNEYLIEGFVQKVDEIVESFDQGGYDPFLCAQGVPDSISVGSMDVAGNTARVSVSTSFENHQFTVLLWKVNDHWEITDVVCDLR